MGFFAHYSFSWFRLCLRDIRILMWIMNISLESPTSIYTSSTTPVSLFRIFQLRGRRWRSWKNRVLSSKYIPHFGLFSPSCTFMHSESLEFSTLYLRRLTLIPPTFNFRSIGVSNFGVNDLAVLLASAKVPPAANQVCVSTSRFVNYEHRLFRTCVWQILLHPYVYATQAPIIEYAKKHNIVIEAYSALM